MQQRIDATQMWLSEIARALATAETALQPYIIRPEPLRGFRGWLTRRYGAVHSSERLRPGFADVFNTLALLEAGPDDMQTLPSSEALGELAARYNQISSHLAYIERLCRVSNLPVPEPLQSLRTRLAPLNSALQAHRETAARNRLQEEQQRAREAAEQRRQRHLVVVATNIQRGENRRILGVNTSGHATVSLFPNDDSGRPPLHISIRGRRRPATTWFGRLMNALGLPHAEARQGMLFSEEGRSGETFIPCALAGAELDFDAAYDFLSQWRNALEDVSEADRVRATEGVDVYSEKYTGDFGFYTRNCTQIVFETLGKLGAGAYAQRAGERSVPLELGQYAGRIRAQVLRKQEKVRTSLDGEPDTNAVRVQLFDQCLSLRRQLITHPANAQQVMQELGAHRGALYFDDSPQSLSPRLQRVLGGEGTLTPGERLQQVMREPLGEKPSFFAFWRRSERREYEARAARVAFATAVSRFLEGAGSEVGLAARVKALQPFFPAETRPLLDAFRRHLMAGYQVLVAQTKQQTDSRGNYGAMLTGLLEASRNHPHGGRTFLETAEEERVTAEMLERLTPPPVQAATSTASPWFGKHLAPRAMVRMEQYVERRFGM